jgi:beta-N-acetylhexosaminidase
MPWAMTAHIVYEALDPDFPATLSARVIRETIRGNIGFDGVLVSDDLSMHALGGPLEGRARQALAAGCDLVLHCNGEQTEMEEIAAGTDALSPEACRRLARAEARRQRPASFDRNAAEARLDTLISGCSTCTAAKT